MSERERVKAKRQYVVTEIVVTGRGEIPLDMLRFDRCSPASSDDVSAILNGRADHRIAVEIRLYRFSPDGSKATVARWHSFGWDVISDTGTATP